MNMIEINIRPAAIKLISCSGYESMAGSVIHGRPMPLEVRP